MTNLDLYSKAEPLLGIEEATQKLHELYLNKIKNIKNAKTLLDVGCGNGSFIQKSKNMALHAKGCDLSKNMIDICKKKNLDAVCADISEIDESFDIIVSIFDVLNFMDKKELFDFFLHIEKRLNKNGIFIADINTLYGFEEVAQGSMSNENETLFLNVDAFFEDNKLFTTFTLFEKTKNGCYQKYQDEIIQYFHPIKFFEKIPNLKLIKKQKISLYANNDKILLIFKKSK